VSIPPSLRFTLNVIAKRNDDSLHAKNRRGDWHCLMTINIGAAVTTAKPDITAGLPERKRSRPYILQTGI
jgi:hypothetical protein